MASLSVMREAGTTTDGEFAGEISAENERVSRAVLEGIVTLQTPFCKFFFCRVSSHYPVM